MKKLKIYFIDTNLIPISVLSLSPYISDKELDDLASYKMEKSRKEKIASTILKNRFVGDYHLDENDKPVSDHCYFNVSHSRGYVVFVMDESQPIGIDIELTKEVNDSLVNYVCTEEEKESIKENIDFFKQWTSKESLLKAYGSGIKENLKQVPALPLDGKKEYLGETYFCQCITYKELIISVTRKSSEPFAVEIVEDF